MNGPIEAAPEAWFLQRVCPRISAFVAVAVALIVLSLGAGDHQLRPLRLSSAVWSAHADYMSEPTDDRPELFVTIDDKTGIARLLKFQE
jgi:hypothetical protein